MFDFNNNNAAAMGPLSLDDQAAQLKKRQLMAQMLQADATQATKNASPNTASALANLGAAVAGNYMGGQLNQQNNVDAERLKRNQLAQMLSNGGV